MNELCVCGHALGRHTAAVVDGARPCLVGEVPEPSDHGADCNCETFRKPRKRPTAARAGVSVTFSEPSIIPALVVAGVENTCERCGRLLGSGPCTAHGAPIPCAVRSTRRQCPGCKGALVTTAAPCPGDSALCARCGAELSFVPPGRWSVVS